MALGLNAACRQCSSAKMAKAELVVFGVIPRVFDSQGNCA